MALIYGNSYSDFGTECVVVVKFELRQDNAEGVG